MIKVEGIIYCIQNKKNLKQYVGQTIGNLNYRLSKHFSDAVRTNNNTAIGSAIRKYGKESFIIFELEKCSIENLNEREAHWILFLNTYKKGYNRQHRSNHDRQEIKKIIKEFLNGSTQEELSKKYHICKKTIKYHLDKNNIDTNLNNNRSFKTYKTKEIIKLYKEGYSIREISKKVHSCKKTISKILKKNNLEIKKGANQLHGHPYRTAS
jgi:group I intron endonuclease